MKNSIMKHIIIISIFINVFVFWHCNKCNAQELIIRGSIHCKPGGHLKYEKPINEECVIVIPSVDSRFAVLASDAGVFDIKLPYQRRYLNNILFINYYFNKEKIGSSKIFIDRKNINEEEQDFVFEISEPILLKKNCEFLVIEPDSCLSDLNELVAARIYPKRGGRWFWVSMGTVILGGSAAWLGGTQYALEDIDSTKIETIEINSIKFPDMHLGEIVNSLYRFNSWSYGINFAPVNNFEKSLLFNSSSIAFSEFKNFYFNSDFKRYYEFNYSTPVFHKFSAGIGLIYIEQNAKTVAKLSSNIIHKELIPANTILGFMSFAYKLNEEISIGLATKYIRQNIESPVNIKKVKDYRDGKISVHQSFRTIPKSISHFDCDLSTTLQLSNSINAGINIFNLLNTKLIGENNQSVSSRNIGLGVTYQKRRFTIGTDILLSKNAKPFVAHGLNFIMSNWLDIRTSIANRFEHFQTGITLKILNTRFDYTYSYNNLFSNSHLVGMHMSF